MPSPTSTPANGNHRSSRSGASPKTSLLVIFKLPSDSLSRYSGIVPDITKEDVPSTPHKVKDGSSPASSSADLAVPRSSADNASDAASTPATGAAAADTPNKAGQKSGTKRNSDAMSKSKGKPGPKKKPKVYDFYSFLFFILAM